MRQAVQTALLVAALLLAYQAYQRYSYVPGAHTSASLGTAIELADRYNARTDPKVAEYLKQVEKTGDLDVDRLGELLRPIAKKAGGIVRLERELGALSKGQVPAPAPSVPAQRKPAETPPARLPGSLAIQAAAPGPPPLPLPDPEWDVTTPADPARWHKAVPEWAGSQQFGIQKWSVGGQTVYGMEPSGLPPSRAFSSTDADERELARVILAHTLQLRYRQKFGQVQDPVEGAPKFADYFKEFVKGHYRDKARIVLSGE